MLFRAGLLQDGGSGWYEHRHALIRQALYDEMPPPRRAVLHEAAFRSLLTRGAAPAEAAEQALAAGLHGDPTAVAALAGAGREAFQAGAVRAARRYLAAAAEQAGASADPGLLIELGRALTADGAIDLAVGLFEGLLGRATLDQATRATIQGLAGRAAFSGADPEQAARWFASAARTAAHGHRALAAQAQLDHAFVTWVRLGPQAALTLAVRASELAGEDVPLRAGAEATRALCAYLTGDPTGLETAEAVAGGTRVHGDPLDTAHWALEPAGVPGDVAVWAEQFEKAEVLFGQLLIDAERSGNPFAAFHASFSWSEGLWRLGRLSEALAMADRVEEIAELLPIAAPFSAATKAMTYLEIGDLDHARQHAEKLAYLAHGNPWFLVQGYDLHRRATLALRLGAVEEAGLLFTTLEQRCDAWGVVDMAAIPWASGAIQAHLARERPDDARRVLTRVEQAAAQLPSRWPKLVAATGRALLAERDGDREQAAARFGDVLRLQADLALPLARAEALTACGAFWNRCRDARRARPILAEAQRIAEGCGAGWYTRRARVEWRRAGGRAGGAAPDRLTPQETEVVRLARAGRTNRQIAQELFLSVNTVETHLAHAYRKLGIRRRWELIARDDDL
jgi:DNA-binding CsgD family transcriptional regulator